MGHARDDRLESSPLWRRSLGRSHGVFVATGVQEMADAAGVRTALWFRRTDGAPILMPGRVGPLDGRAAVSVVLPEGLLELLLVHPRAPLDALLLGFLVQFVACLSLGTR